MYNFTKCCVKLFVNKKKLYLKSLETDDENSEINLIKIINL